MENVLIDTPDRVFMEKLVSGQPEETKDRLWSLFKEVKAASKSELHFHLAGSMRPETLLDLAASGEYPIDWSISNKILHAERDMGDVIREGGLRKAKELIEYREQPGSLQRYLDLYSIPQTVFVSRDIVRRVALEASEAVYSDGVRKLELRFNPIRMDGHILPAEMVYAVSDALREAEEAFPGLRTGLIICINKMFSRERVAGIVKFAVEIVRQGRDDGHIVAVDTSGPEIGFEPEKFAGPFEEAREKGGLGVVCHAGEDFLAIEDGLQAIEKSVKLLKARRIGHGLAAGLNLEDLRGTVDGKGRPYSEERLARIGEMQEEVLSLLVDSDVAVEVCPSSNIHTGKISDLENHPVDRFLRAGVPVAVCTDNMRISHTKLSWEHLRLARAFGYGSETLGKLIETGNRYSFV